MIGGQILDNFKYEPHQVIGIKRLMNTARQAMSFGTGTGKTLTFLGAFAACRKLGRGTRAIVICDRSSVVSIMEDLKTHTALNYQFIESKDEAPFKDSDIVLVTYNRASDLLSYLHGARMLPEFSHLILDEAHKLKNPDSNTARVLSQYRDFFKYVWLSTATFMSNDIMDVHGMMNFLVPGYLGDKYEFKNEYCMLEQRTINAFRRMRGHGGPGRQYKQRQQVFEIVGYKNLNALAEKLSSYVFYYAREHDIRFQVLELRMKEWENTSYHAASTGFDHRKLREDDEVPYTTRLHDLQLVLDIPPANRDRTTKQEALLSWCASHEMDGGIVYFSYREALSSCVEMLKGQYSIEIITGDSDAKERLRVKKKLKPGTFLFMTDAGGQCFARGTRVLMSDGSVKEIQNIVEGDCVMGPDSTFREVESVHSGVDNLYKVESFRGDSYVVSERSTLSFIRGESYRKEHVGSIVDVTLLNYLKKTKWEKSTLRRWKVPVEYGVRSLRIPPYVLGLWLGDGCRWGSTLYVKTGDAPILDAWCSYGKELGLQVKESVQNGCLKVSLTTGVVGRVTTNPLILNLKKYDLIRNKHIPKEYIFSSVGQRLELLAGIIDTDGYLHNDVGYEIITSLKTFSLELKTLINSLGLYAKISTSRRAYAKGSSEKVRYRVTVSGDCSVIPVRLSYKKATINSSGRALLYRCKISTYGRGNHYGFSLKGEDKHFLLEDGTVVHNSLNLDSVNQLLFYDTPYSIVTVSQTIGRIVRMSSPYTEFYIYFLSIKETIDEYKVRLISTHSELVKQILGGYRNLPDMKYHSPEVMKALRRSLLWKQEKRSKKRED